MDVILVMTEQGQFTRKKDFVISEPQCSDACDAQFPLTVLEDLMEAQTIESCSHVFSWMEDRFSRLTLVRDQSLHLILNMTLSYQTQGYGTPKG